MTQRKFVSDLAEGDQVSEQFYVSFKRPVRKYTGGYLLEIRVGDKTGEIPVKLWGGRNESAVQTIYDSIKEGDIVLVTGMVSKYRDNLEISSNPEDRQGVKRLSPGEYNLENFVARTEADIDLMFDDLLKFIETVEDPYLKGLLTSFFKEKEFSDRFKTSPAAIKHHGNVIGGLLEHTLRVVRMVDMMSMVYNDLDRDLMLTGALLHDIGKIDEYQVTTKISATDQGRLVGHIFLGAESIRRRICQIEGFPEVLAWKVQHTILSSHGLREYGSPVEPMFPEALAISLADDIDAQMDKMMRLMRNTKTDDDWTYHEDIGSVYLR